MERYIVVNQGSINCVDEKKLISITKFQIVKDNSTNETYLRVVAKNISNVVLGAISFKCLYLSDNDDIIGEKIFSLSVDSLLPGAEFGKEQKFLIDNNTTSVSLKIYSYKIIDQTTTNSFATKNNNEINQKRTQTNERPLSMAERRKQIQQEAQQRAAEEQRIAEEKRRIAEEKRRIAEEKAAERRRKRAEYKQTKKYKIRRNVSLISIAVIIVTLISSMVISNAISQKKEREEERRKQIELARYLKVLKTPETLVEESNKTLEDTENFVYMGLYPQSKKDETVEVIYYKDDIYIGKDGYRYVKKYNIYYKLEPIKWKKIVTTNGLMLLSEKILDYMEFDNGKNNVRYKESTLRSFLNNTFYEKAFTDEEKYKIANVALDEFSYDEDKIFLLSVTDVNNLDHEYDIINSVSNTQYANLGKSWWVRSTVNYNTPEYVNRYGEIISGERSDKYGVRPAFIMNDVYTITYDYSGAEDINNPAIYTPKDEIINITNPTRAGYTFLGWSGTGLTEQTQNIVITSGSTGNKIYKANWKANTYTITYDANGGTVSQTTQKVTYDETHELYTPNRLNYTFDGWYEDTTKYNNYGAWKTAKDVTLVAKWTPIEYLITYNLVGGENWWNNPKTYTVEDNITLNDPTREGYTFLGWSGIDLNGQTKNVVINSGSTGDRYYTANWQVNTYKITYDYNDGVTAQTTQQVTYDSNVTLPTPTREGYAFIGWYSGTTKYTNGTWKTPRDVTLTAKWEVRKYNISYTLDGGSEINPTTYSIESENITLKEPTREGYDFLGWSGTDLEGQTKNVVINIGSTGNRYYTAHWQAKTYIVTYDARGGTVIPTQQEVIYDSDFTLAIPTKENNTFVGWYNNSTRYDSGIWKIARDITLTAKWAKVDNPEYDENGNIIAFTFGQYPQTIKDSSITISSSVSANGYYLGSDGAYYKQIIAQPFNIGQKFTNNTPINKYTEYYFKVEPIRWKVLYDYGNDKYKIISDLVLDGSVYNSDLLERTDIMDYLFEESIGTVYANNYQFSNIREFINLDFYDDAFDEEEKDKIVLTTVKNDADSTGISGNIYSCSDTLDCVWLFSYEETSMVTMSYVANASDYARARGVEFNAAGSVWWLRSPGNVSTKAKVVDTFGQLYTLCEVNQINGVRPTITIMF